MSTATKKPNDVERYQVWQVGRILAAVHQATALDGIAVSTVDRATAGQWRADGEVAIGALRRFLERLPRGRP